MVACGMDVFTRAPWEGVDYWKIKVESGSGKVPKG